MSTFDLKSLALGIALGAGTLIALGADDDDAADPRQFQLSAYAETDRTGAYILDTRTGALWHSGTRFPAPPTMTSLGTVQRPKLDEIPLVN